MKFKLGDLVKDVLSGFSGIVTATSIALNNCDRVSIQPVAKDGETVDKPFESFWFDEPQVELVESGYINEDFVIQPDECIVKLGDIVKHKYTGYEGYVNQIAFWISGCTRLSIQPKMDKDGKLPESYWISDKEVEIINPTKETFGTKTGGPFDNPKKMSNPRR